MPRGNNQNNEGIPGPQEMLRALRDPIRDLRERYINDPVGLAERFHLKLPRNPLVIMQERGLYDPEKHGPILPGLRDLVEDVCLGRVQDAAAVANRGGGKSMGVSFIEFFLVFLKLYDALNLGGSELQADQVYQYLLSYIESDPYWRSLIKGETLQSKTTTIDNAWIRVLTASQKSVRSPHAGGRKKDGRMAGGLLVIDEEAEADAQIVSASLGTINTAQPSVNIRCSTFHNAFGSFAELIDSHQEMGYKLYKWGIFDVVQPCDCTGSCQHEEKCFREDHYEQFPNPETGAMERKLVHRAYCGGRAMFAEGWIPVDEVTKMWRRMKRNHATFEVEAMGSRPTSSGFVIKNQQSFLATIQDVDPESLYVVGSPVTICVDWGTVAAGITVWQEQFGDQHVCLHAEELREAGETQILGTIIGLGHKFQASLHEIAADIGGGGNYLNPKLREEHRFNVRDVSFAEEKESAAAAWNVYSEGGNIIIPAQFEVLIEQVKKWRRKQGRIVKGNDHVCDSTLCYFAKFVDRLGLNHIRIVPRSVSSTVQDEHRNSNVAPAGKAGITGFRTPLVRSINRRR